MKLSDQTRRQTPKSCFVSKAGMQQREIRGQSILTGFRKIAFQGPKRAPEEGKGQNQIKVLEKKSQIDAKFILKDFKKRTVRKQNQTASIHVNTKQLATKHTKTQNQTITHKLQTTVGYPLKYHKPQQERHKGKSKTHLSPTTRALLPSYFIISRLLLLASIFLSAPQALLLFVNLSISCC